MTGQKLKFNSNEMDIFGNLFHDDTVQIPSHPLSVNLPQSQSKYFMCDICNDLFSLKSVMTNCGHYFCSVCLSGVLRMPAVTLNTVLHVNALSILMIFSQSRRNSKNSY